MAPAAADTIFNFLQDTSTSPTTTISLSPATCPAWEAELLCELLSRKGVNLGKNYTDCGLLIYDRNKQDVHAGGSGCGCSAAVLNSYILSKMERKELNSVLFIGTGALMSPTSSQQGESIPGIAHLVHLVTA